MLAWLVGVLTALGSLMCLLSVMRYRPSRFIPAPVVATVGWEIVACLILLRSTVQLALTHGGSYAHSDDTVTKVFGIASLLVIDGLIVWRYSIFHRFTSNYNAERERLERQSN